MVEKDVPCLLSTGVLRRLGGILDFPAECVRFSVVSADVPLVNIDTGHVGVPVRFPAGCLPAVSEAAIARAEAGAEVTACDEVTEQRLMKDHRTMTVSKDVEDVPTPEPVSDCSSECSCEDAELCHLSRFRN